MTEPITIELTQGFTTIIDAVDADLAEFKWHILRLPKTDIIYAKRQIAIAEKQTTELLHRVILSRMVGRPLKRRELVDHINMDGLDNRRTNLRVASQSQNLRNRGKPSTNNSGYKGVSWFNLSSKWRTQIQVNGKQIHIGLFDTPEEAHDAYCEASAKYHGEFGRTS